MSYRPEIDGLRAVAVVPVILFHGGISGFSGGFVGVDVFFVISGYLITSILLREMGQGRFSLWRFWERRARRILPALVLVMVCCIPFAWMWMLPDQYLAFSRSLIAVSVFASNILFWRESGYFAAAAEEKPLLHTWSLAVEEQFYILFPLAALSWRLVEQPFRLGPVPWLPRRRQIFAAAGIAGAVFIGIGAFGHATQGAAFRIDMPEPLHASLHDRAFEAACFNRAPGDDAPVRDWFCTPAALDGPARDRRVAVIGDSHALSYLPGLVAGLADHGIGVAFSGVAGCPPLKDTFIYRSDHLRAVCNARNAQVFEGLRAEGVEAVILIARWAMYAHGDLPQSQRYMDTRYAVRRDKAHTLTVFVERLTATLDHLEQAGLPVWILHQPPLQAHEPSNLYARFLLQGEGPDFLRRHSLRREAHDALYAPTRAHLEAEAAPRARVATLDPADRICGEDICLIGTARQAVYIDRNHLSNPGAAPVARILANQIAARLAADRYDAHRPVACASGRNCAPDPKPDPKKDAPR